MKQDDKEKEYLALLGYIFMRYGKWDKGKIIFEALQSLFPDDSYYHKTLGYLYLKTGEPAKALEQAQELISRAAGKGDLSLGYFLKSKALYDLGRKEQAEETINQILALKNSQDSQDL